MYGLTMRCNQCKKLIDERPYEDGKQIAAKRAREKGCYCNGSVVLCPACDSSSNRRKYNNAKKSLQGE